MRMRRGYFVKNPIAFVGLVVLVCYLLVIVVSVLRLPDVSIVNRVKRSYAMIKGRRVLKDEGIGKFGEMMIEMLPEDLAFTVFIPSEKAFERDLRLSVNDSLSIEKKNDTYAVVSRILGFSAVPRRLLAAMVCLNKGVSYDSISGFPLYISKGVDGMLVVNRVQTERVNILRGEIIVHIMDGIIMDAEFEQSVQPDDTQDDGD